MTRQRRFHPVIATGVVTATVTVLLAGCAMVGGTTDAEKRAAPAAVTTSAPPKTRLTVGRAVPALRFAANRPASSPFAAGSVPPADAPVVTSPSEAVDTFVSSLLRGDPSTTWALTSSTDRVRLGYVQRISDQVGAMGWRSFTTSSTVGDAVTLEVTQTPSISDIDGVVAATATVRVPTVLEGGARRVVWSRRRLEQHFPEASPTEDGRAAEAVVSWVTARQRCDGSPPNQFAVASPASSAWPTGCATPLARQPLVRWATWTPWTNPNPS